MRSTIALGLACAAAACSGGGAATRALARAPLAQLRAQPPAPPLAPSAGLHPGEAMTFAVSLGGIEAGEAELAVGEPGVLDGAHVIVATSRIASAGVFKLVKDIRDDLTTTIDVDTGLPRTIVADATFPTKLYHADGRFHGPQIDLDWYRDDRKVRHSHFDFRGHDAHTAHTAMAAVRAWDGAPGDTRELYVIGGRKIWKTDVTWVGHETIGTALGNVAAVRLDGVSTRVTGALAEDVYKESRTFTVWMSDDADRVPLRVVAHTELGDVTFELTGYERP